MNSHHDSPLQIGETVRYNHHNTGISSTGIVVGRLREDCLRVLWDDMEKPTTHHSYSLSREPSAGSA